VDIEDLGALGGLVVDIFRLSVYAPTAKAPLNVKAKFIGDLQHTLDTLRPAGDVVVILCDFNARIGKRESEDDVWQEVRLVLGCNQFSASSVFVVIVCGSPFQDSFIGGGIHSLQCSV